MPGGKGKITGADGNTFSKTNQPKKRRGKSLLTKIKKKIFDESEYISFKGVEVVDDKGNPTGEKVNVRVKMTNEDAIIMHYFHRLKTNDRLLIDLLDRIDGKPISQIDITTKGESFKDADLNEDQLRDELNRLLKNK